jgi:hypothetical protein
MKARITLAILIVLSMLITSVGFAEDGLIMRRNVSKTPDLETEKAGVFMMDFYVPAQAATGALVTIDNYILEDESVAAEYADRTYAKPLVSVYIDGTTEWQDHLGGGIVLGAFDAFVGVSLDDGDTWKTTNVSRSADLSSFTGTAAGVNQGLPYPGTVHQLVHQVFGDNILVAWASKYCDGGTPLYTLDPAVTETAAYLDDLETTYLKDAVYLYDFFGVAGSQGSVNYTPEGFPEVGEIPYSCIWTARGKLLAGDDPSTTETESTYVIWAKPERLTSGTRDANLPAVDCAGGAGCMLTWQEDPDGLRPGQGLGPGEGWSGAVAWAQTDIWYSHISAAEFDKVFAAEDTVGAITMAEYALLTDATMPKPYVPMAMPVRLTDNAMCKYAKDSDPYCYIDFDTIDDIDHTNVDTLLALEGPEEGADFCAYMYTWDTPDDNPLTTVDVCVTEDERVLNGRVASTRVRMNLKPYNPNTSDVINDNGTDDPADDFVEKSAWIVMAAEESKALGDVLVEDTEDPLDIGKDVWYYSFDPFKTGADEAMILQGGMLNQPAQCSFDAGEDDPLCAGLDEGSFYPTQTDDRGYEYYLTEIARRFALTTNSVDAAMSSSSGLSAMLIYKQGIINQGGPADIMLRRLLIDDTVFDPAVDNPYAYENMECDEWVYTDVLNPNYLQGLCKSPAINLSGSTIVECDGATGNDACADTFPLNDDGSNNVPSDFPKVYEWRQCQPGAQAEICVDPDDDNDLDDQTWENPFDVAKGHRGFLDGDYVMMMYAWSPNWNSNAVGNDHYNLYVRRSFDGGLTWTTTPSSWCDDEGNCGDGVTALENYYDGKIGVPLPTYFTYGAGDFEQARNVSLLVGNKVTILDPRYTPAGGMKLFQTIRTDWLEANGLTVSTDLPYADDEVRDPSKYFMVYETGDNTTVAEGEATPLDLFYSRATVYGDVYEWFDYLQDSEDCNPVDGVIADYAICAEPRWPWLENKTEILSGEAAMLANPGATFAYNVWNQWQEEITYDDYGIEHEHVHDSDMPFRRLLYVTDETLVSSDFQPVSSILYVNTDMADWDTEILLVGSARDLDKMNNSDTDDDGIVEARWKDEYEQGLEWNERTWNFKPQGFKPGHHDFSFQAKDNEGNWSSPKTVTIWIAEKFYNTYLPIVTR